MAPPDAGHLSEHEIAGFIDDDLALEERARVVAHLDQCAACRRELTEMQQVVDAYDPPRVGQLVAAPATTHTTPTLTSKRWRTVAGVGALAAAAAFAALLLTDQAADEDAATPRLRDAAVATDEGRRRITVVSPAESATVSARTALFSWQATGADLYRFMLLSESGEPVWTHETPDTTVQIPTSVLPAKEGVYFWRVDAIADGVSATSGVRMLRMSR